LAAQHNLYLFWVGFQNICCAACFFTAKIARGGLPPYKPVGGLPPFVIHRQGLTKIDIFDKLKKYAGV